MDLSLLPPKPDPHTGEPRPPHAPFDGRRQMVDRDERARHKVPQPPEQYGPILEWYYPTRGNRWFQTLLVPGIGIALYTLMDWGFDWMRVWYLWVILVACGAGMALFVFPTNGTSAGSDWVSRKTGKILNTYQLTKAKMRAGGNGAWLDLEDSSGNVLFINQGELQRNPALWDLVYNGILHSVHRGGADTNSMAQRRLQLNNPPSIR